MEEHNKNKRRYHFLNKAFFWSLSFPKSEAIEQDEPLTVSPILPDGHQ